MAAAAVILGAAGCGSSGATPSQKTVTSSAPPPSSARPMSAKPMAKMPAGTHVSLVHKGQLTVCPLYGDPFLYPDPDHMDPPDIRGSTPAPLHTGFAVDLFTLIGQRLSATPIVESWMQPTAIFSDDPLGRKYCDIVAGAVTTTPDIGDATIPYFKDSQALLTLDSAPYTSLAALRGKRVGVESGTSSEKYLNSYNNQHGNTILVDNNTGYSATFPGLLQEKEVDAVVTTRASAMHLASQSHGVLRATNLSGPAWTVVFMVRRGNKGLLTQINAALADAAANGQYAKAYRTWFGTAPTWLPGQS